MSYSQLSQIRAILGQPRKPSRQWAVDLLAREANGERLLPVQVEMARAALGPQYAVREREPGEN